MLHFTRRFWQVRLFLHPNTHTSLEHVYPPKKKLVENLLGQSRYNAADNCTSHKKTKQTSPSLSMINCENANRIADTVFLPFVLLLFPPPANELSFGSNYAALATVARRTRE